MNKRLQAVTDGRGQLIAIADSSGQITETYAGSGHDQSSWQGAGLTTQAQTFDPRKWQTNADWGGIQQFRNRAYDPATGTWIQEDPMGVAGGVNLYRFNNGNPVSFGDPLGLCPEWKDKIPCKDPVDSPMRAAQSPEPSGVGGSEFGMTRSGGTQSHNGFDWAAVVGTNVVAPADGTVKFVPASLGGKAGNHVQIDFGNGTSLSILHLDSFSDDFATTSDGVTTANVKAGTVLGTTGRTGNAARSPRESHAHIITRVGGKPCNPRDFLSPTGGGGSCQE